MEVLGEEMLEPEVYDVEVWEVEACEVEVCEVDVEVDKIEELVVVLDCTIDVVLEVTDDETTGQ